MTDAYIASTRRSVRTTLYRRLKTLGLGQDAITRAVAMTSAVVMSKTGVSDLAQTVAAAGSLHAALAAADPENPAIAEFETFRSGIGGAVGDLLDDAFTLE